MWGSEPASTCPMQCLSQNCLLTPSQPILGVTPNQSGWRSGSTSCDLEVRLTIVETMVEDVLDEVDYPVSQMKYWVARVFLDQNCISLF